MKGKDIPFMVKHCPGTEDCPEELKDVPINCWDMSLHWMNKNFFNFAWWSSINRKIDQIVFANFYSYSNNVLLYYKSNLFRENIVYRVCVPRLTQLNDTRVGCHSQQVAHFVVGIPDITAKL